MRALVSLLLLTSLFVVDDARACACDGVTVQVPTAGSVVPPDVRFVYRSTWTSEPGGVVDADGNAVDVAFRAHGRFWIADEHPPLPVGTYTWSHDEDDAVSFTVDDVVVGAIAPPVVTVTSSHGPTVFPGGCGGEGWVTYDVEHDGAIAVVALADDVVDGDDFRRARLSQGVLGRAGCTTNWPGAAAFASTQFVVGAFDAAGRFSGWSAPVRASVPGPGASCASVHAADDDAPWVALLLLGLVPRRRR